ncbi:MAG: phosphatidylglycerophosphatase A [Pseudomonadota bacterium]
MTTLPPESRPARPSVRTVLRDPVLLLAHGLGSGLAPKAPGTFGTIAALLPWWFMAPLDLPVYLVIVLFAALAGVWLCGEAASRMQRDDPGSIVWDEWVGLWVALAGLPLEWPWILAGLVLFRLFDILKPWPVGWLDRHFHGGMGIMLDDIAAGAITAALLHLAQTLQ